MEDNKISNRGQLRIKQKQWNDRPRNDIGTCNKIDADIEYIHTTNGKGMNKTNIIKQRKESWNCNKEGIHVCKDNYAQNLKMATISHPQKQNVEDQM